MQDTVRIDVDDVFPFRMKKCHIQCSGFSLLGVHPFQIHLRILLLIGCINFKRIIFTAVIDKQDIQLLQLIFTVPDRIQTGIQSICRIIDRNDQRDRWIISKLRIFFIQDTLFNKQKKSCHRRYDLHEQRNNDPGYPENNFIRQKCQYSLHNGILRSSVLQSVIW